MSKRTAAIDGDMIIYKAGFASEVETRWSDAIWTLHSSEDQMKLIVDDMMEYIIDTVEADDYCVVFSDQKNFRHELFSEYKANRKNKRKPLGLQALQDWMFGHYNGKRWKNLEADDVIGMLCSKQDNMVAVSGDKDFGTLPCEWFNFLKAETSHTTEEEANYNHLSQTLSGDSVDGFSGASGVGPVTANKILDKKGATWETVVATYESKGQTEEDALLNARLSYILRNKNEYNKQKGQVKLWTPTKK